MTLEDRDTKIRIAISEAINKGNVDALDELVSPAYLYHRPPGPDIKGVEGYKQMFLDMRKAFSNINFVIEDHFSSADMHASRYTMTCTHTGQMAQLPIPPTGKQMTMTGLVMVRWADDKAIEEWEYVDMLGFMHQLGVIPPISGAGK